MSLQQLVSLNLLSKSGIEEMFGSAKLNLILDYNKEMKVNLEVLNDL